MIGFMLKILLYFTCHSSIEKMAHLSLSSLHPTPLTFPRTEGTTDKLLWLLSYQIFLKLFNSDIELHDYCYRIIAAWNYILEFYIFILLSRKKCNSRERKFCIFLKYSYLKKVKLIMINLLINIFLYLAHNISKYFYFKFNFDSFFYFYILIFLWNTKTSV